MSLFSQGHCNKWISIFIYLRTLLVSLQELSVQCLLKTGCSSSRSWKLCCLKRFLAACGCPGTEWVLEKHFPRFELGNFVWMSGENAKESIVSSICEENLQAVRCMLWSGSLTTKLPLNLGVLTTEVNQPWTWQSKCFLSCCNYGFDLLFGILQGFHLAEGG